MNKYLEVYLICNAIVIVSFVLSGLYYDLLCALGKRTVDRKFGYNYKSGMFWVLTATLTIPGMNVVLACGLLWISITDFFKKN